MSDVAANGQSATGEVDDVVLLSDARQPVGRAPRATVHGPDTPLHLAFSSYLIDRNGHLLLTRRALQKRTWPGVWTNSCCGHPRPGEPPPDAIRRRVAQELGLEVTELHCVIPEFQYRAVDAGGVVENEVCPVFIGRVHDENVAADPGEVAEYGWVPWSDVAAAMSATPLVFSPWSVAQMARLGPVLPVF